MQNELCIELVKKKVGVQNEMDKWLVEGEGQTGEMGAVEKQRKLLK